MRSTNALVGAVLAFWMIVLVACGAASPQAQGPSMSTVTSQAMARGAVETMESVWITAAKVCKVSEDDGLRAKCQAYMPPARDAIVVAANGVDAWSDASKGMVACSLLDAMNGIQFVADAQGHGNAPLIGDARALINALGCNRYVDAGGQ